MGFSRAAVPAQLPEGSRLTADMIGIGMLFVGKGTSDPNIEDTLVAASIEAMDRGDLRVLSVLVTWIEVHHARINADRLVRIMREYSPGRVRTFWAAVGAWLSNDRRLARLASLHRGPRVDLLESGTEFQISRKGEDPRFEHTPLRVPAGVLRDRKSDVLAPEALAKSHATYRRRILLGPTYRADMWALLEREPGIGAAELARRTYGSFATAWQALRDYKLLTA